MTVLTPEQIAAAGTELAHQSAIFCAIVPLFPAQPALRLLYAVPNGGERNVIVASRMKASGVRAGVWDLHLPVARGPYHGLWIEMKKPGHERHKKGGLSDDQVTFGLAMHEEGYCTRVCYLWDVALHEILEYLALGPFYMKPKSE